MGTMAARFRGNFRGKTREKHIVSSQGNVKHLTSTSEVWIEVQEWT